MTDPGNKNYDQPPTGKAPAAAKMAQRGGTAIAATSSPARPSRVAPVRGGSR
jgi:hypothetical protein